MSENAAPHRPEPVASDRPTARHRVLHLSDTCLTGPPASGEQSADALDGLLHDARFLRDVDVVVVSGDVCTDGSSSTYAAVRRRVGSFAAGHDASHVYALGDRDDHAGFAEVLGSGHLGPDDLDIGGSGPEGPSRGWCSDVDGLRMITVDTTVPGARHGQLGEDQAQWLAGVLGTPAPHGSVLVLHHPPVSPDSHRHLAGVALRDPERLADVIGGTDVQLVLAGHLGVQLGATLAGVPVLVAPGVSARTDLTSPEHLDRTVRGAGALVIDLGGPFSPRFHTLWARDPRGGEQLDLRDPSSGRVVADEEAGAPVGGPVGGPTTGPTPLSERIPRGESPAPVPRTEPSSWPEELDSSTRSVPPPVAPPPEPRRDPVWLTQAPAENDLPPADRRATGAADPAVALPSLPDAPSLPRPRPRVPVRDAAGSDLEDTVLLAAVDESVRSTPEDAPEPDEGERDDDSGVLSWAFTSPEDDHAQREPRSDR